MMYICNCIVHVSHCIVHVIIVNCLYSCFWLCFRALSTQQGGHVHATNLYPTIKSYYKMSKPLSFGLSSCLSFCLCASIFLLSGLANQSEIRHGYWALSIGRDWRSCLFNLPKFKLFISIFGTSAWSCGARIPGYGRDIIIIIIIIKWIKIYLKQWWLR